MLFVGVRGYDEDPKRVRDNLNAALQSHDPEMLSGYPVRLQGESSPLIKDLRKAYAKKRNYRTGDPIGGRYYGPWWYGDGILLRAR